MGNKLKIVLLVLVSVLTFNIVGCKSSSDRIHDRLDSITVDSSSVDTATNKYDADAQLFELSRDHSIALDSLESIRNKVDSLKLQLGKVIKTKDSVVKVNITNKEKLAVAEYKLLRIREYNRIAGQGNNIKFLRGWIIRTLNH